MTFYFIVMTFYFIVMTFYFIVMTFPNHNYEIFNTKKHIKTWI